MLFVFNLFTYLFCISVLFYSWLRLAIDIVLSVLFRMAERNSDNVLSDNILLLFYQVH